MYYWVNYILNKSNQITVYLPTYSSNYCAIIHLTNNNDYLPVIKVTINKTTVNTTCSLKHIILFIQYQTIYLKKSF